MRPRPLIICYHAVSGTWPSGLAIGPDHLRDQLAWFRRQGFTGYTVTAAERLRRDGLLPEKALVVTFDDGYASTRQAAHVLREAGFPATVFVPTSFADSGAPLRWPGMEQWVGTEHEAELDPLRWSDLDELHGEGWEVGSHGLSHRLFTRLSNAELERELRDARLAIEARYGTCAALAYPFGIASARVAAAVRDAGYETACTLGRVHDVDEPFRRPRVELTREDTVRRLAVRVSTPFMALRRSTVARTLRRVKGEPDWLPTAG